MRNKRINLNEKRVIISRTDSLGDVVLCLPVAAILKRLFPACTVIFLGKAYTRDLILCCDNVDEFADWDALKQEPDGLRSLRADAILHIFPVPDIAASAYEAGIPLRLGSTGRMYHWKYCNKLVRLSRRHSKLHEAQLNLKLLVPLGAKRSFSLNEIQDLYGLTRLPHLSDEQKILLDPDCFNLIIHPGSQGSAREWGYDNFAALAGLLPAGRYRVFVTGSGKESDAIRETLIKQYPQLIDCSGRFSLAGLIAFIANADGIVAGSTGPLHIAAALGRTAIGIYPPIRPMHPGRWAPLGPCAYTLVSPRNCSRCRKTGVCQCMQEIRPEMVRDKLFEIFH